MGAYEYDILEIPEEYKKMSLAEITEAEENLLRELVAKKRTKKVAQENERHIVFNL